jgi:hypothetical protein
MADADGGSTAVNVNPWDDSAVASGAARDFEFERKRNSIPRCHGSTAAFAVPSAPAGVGTTVPIEALRSVVSNGFVSTDCGTSGVDAVGCGLQSSGTEGLLLSLAPSPTRLSFVSMLGGQATIQLEVPADLGLVGLDIALQCIVIDPTNAVSELSNALEFDVVP